jgi:hypothetical protein
MQFLIKKHTMNYPLFLFSKLYDVFVGVNYEYDLMYEDLQKLYDLFLDSGFNNPNYSEYDCMVEFFKENRLSLLENLLNKHK